MNVLYRQESCPWPCIQLLIITKNEPANTLKRTRSAGLSFSSSLTLAWVVLPKETCSNSPWQGPYTSTLSLKRCDPLKKYIFLYLVLLLKQILLRVSTLPFLLYCFLSLYPISKVIHSIFPPTFLLHFLWKQVFQNLHDMISPLSPWSPQDKGLKNKPQRA